ncbi:hypothetical protein HC931_28645 [Candidatus Gracilibacteria bacterium]|nr:hypothetical protein [Candidatus Gracilibacteria bacterium]
MNSSWFELTMEQEFQMRLMEESVEQMTREQMQDLLLETARLLMVKENVLRNVIKSCPLGFKKLIMFCLIPSHTPLNLSRITAF